ncbi:translation initiation factor IF-2-like isoform X2 [Prionailurus bengalensis]|uniref:translation initiation factor IF-2-like isoform X2 n=1 Tax=Prionailurus bengalensis TaxID=37029 RepID=UPI001CA9CAE7|nr:translation initiation factor IF-2-like isoform X2 [Prionailurus bengalensis]
MTVTGQTASGTTRSLAVTWGGRRRSQASGRSAGSGRGPGEPVPNPGVGLEKNPSSVACRLVAPTAGAFRASRRGHARFKEPGRPARPSAEKGLEPGLRPRVSRKELAAPAGPPRSLGRPWALGRGAGRPGSGAGPGVVRAGGEGALWPAAAAWSPQRWPRRSPRPLNGGGRSRPGPARPTSARVALTWGKRKTRPGVSMNRSRARTCFTLPHCRVMGAVCGVGGNTYKMERVMGGGAIKVNVHISPQGCDFRHMGVGASGHLPSVFRIPGRCWPTTSWGPAANAARRSRGSRSSHLQLPLFPSPSVSRKAALAAVNCAKSKSQRDANLSPARVPPGSSDGAADAALFGGSQTRFRHRCLVTGC